MDRSSHRVYEVGFSDQRFYFRRTSSGDAQYFTTKKRPPRAGWAPTGVLCLADGELYVVHWEHSSGETGTWFLNRELQRIANTNLSAHPELKDSVYAQLWLAYLEDTRSRIWTALTTRSLVHDDPELAPAPTFVSSAVMLDWMTVFDSSYQPCQVFSTEEIQDSPNDYCAGIVAEHTLQGLTSGSTYADNWQDDAAINGFIEVPSPFSGQAIRSNKSLLLTSHGAITAYLFQDNGETFFLFSTVRQDKILYLFLNRGVVVHRINDRKLITERNLKAFICFLFVDWNAIGPYLSQKDIRGRAVATSREPHIGHYLWNELTSFERMEKRNALKDISRCYVTAFFDSNDEHYGAIDVLFPELSGKVERLTEQTLARQIYKNNFLFINTGDQFIAESLARKICEHSVSPAVLETCSEELKCFRKNDFFVVILATLRLDNRSWLDQEQGICRLVQRLDQTYQRRIALVIDGHNKSSVGKNLKSHREDSIKAESGVWLSDEEYQIAERIKRSVSSDTVTVVNSIGCSVPESIHWSLLCDFFVAPWGAGMAKYKWIANAPGLVFSSRETLATKFDLHIYDDPAVREGATPCEYLELSAIEDVGATGVFANTDRINFRLSDEALYERVKSLCDRYGRGVDQGHPFNPSRS